MKFFKHLSLTLILLSCNLISGDDEEEEFYYYEPVIGEAYQVVTDLEYKVEFDYQIQQDLVVETEDARGYTYTLEIPSFAVTPGSMTNFEGYIVPLTGIQNLPAGVEFKFGLEIEPFGITFSKPVVITVELPGDFDTEDLRGFYNQGDWGTAYLEPIKIKRTNGKVLAIFSVTHFSSYGGMKAGDDLFNCPDPRSAQTCSDLKEVIACQLGHYELGITEELTGKDKTTVNNILRSYMEIQLQYLEEEPPDYFDVLVFQNDLTEYLCWVAMTQEFNSNPESIFGDLYKEAEYYVKLVFAEHLLDLESTCLQSRSDGDCVPGNIWYTIHNYAQMLEIAQFTGLDQELSLEDIYDFCDGAVNDVLYNFHLIDPVTMNEHYQPVESDHWYKSYQLELSSPDDSIQFMYFMENALGDALEVDLGEIVWQENNSAYYNQDAFIIENGVLRLNKTQEYVDEALNCNPATEYCMDYFRCFYTLHRDNCEIGSVDVGWYKE
jgi:hypothetical protein